MNPRLAKVLASISILVVAFIVAGCAKSEPAKPAFPTKPLEFVAPYGPGGGTDILMRTCASMMKDLKIIEVPINVVNKPGGSSAVGMSYVAAKRGDPHYLLATVSTFLTTPLTGGVGVTYKDFTPICRLGLDPYVVMVKADAPYKTIQELMDAVKQRGTLNCGGTAYGSGEHLLVYRIANAAGVKLNYIPFQSGGEVTTALLGGHVDMIVNNPNESYSQIQGGQFKGLAVSSEARLKELPNVPTLKESGIDVVYYLFRGIAAPADIPPEARQYLENAFKKLSDSEKWKKEYLDKYMITPGWLAGKDFEKYLDEMNEFFGKALKDVGVIK